MNPSELFNKQSELMIKLDSLNSAMEGYGGKIRYNGKEFIATAYIDKNQSVNREKKDFKSWLTISIANTAEKGANYLRNVHSATTFEALKQMSLDVSKQKEGYKKAIEECEDLELKARLILKMAELDLMIQKTEKCGLDKLVKYYATHKAENESIQTERMTKLQEIQEIFSNAAGQKFPVPLLEDHLEKAKQLLESGYDEESKINMLIVLIDPNASREQKELLNLTLSKHPNIEITFKLSKRGNRKVIVTQNSPLAKGAYKQCLLSIQLGGAAAALAKNRSLAKSKVRLERKTVRETLDFKKDVESSIEGSKLLHPDKPGHNARPDLFAKYKKVTLVNTNQVSTSSLITVYAEGGELQNHFEKTEPETRLNFIKDLIAGGRYLEDLGLVHGDFKPQNILIKDGRILIIDFGLLAKKEKLEGIRGTPFYMPPSLNRNPDTKQDNFALGLILLQLATGGKYELEKFDFKAGFYDFLEKSHQNKRIIWLNELKNKLTELLPDNPLAKVIAGLIEPDTNLRMSLTEAEERIHNLSSDQVIFDNLLRALPQAPTVFSSI